jgi:hypothetical protein
VVSQWDIAGIKQLAEERIAERAKQLIQSVASTCQARGIPLFWIIPEFNLSDWRDPIDNAPYLHGDANRESLALH